jgi:cytoskeletal protein RodZ
MKIQSKKKSKAPVVVLIVAIVLLVCGATCWYLSANNIFPFNSPKDQSAQNDSSPQTNDADTNNKQNTNDSNSQTTDQTNNTQDTGPNKNIQNDRPSSGATLNVWVTSKNVVDGVLRIRVQIDQNVSAGTCELSIGSYSQTVPIAFEPQSASCQGFDVPVANYSGNDFTILVKSGEKSGSVEGVINGN